jgi:hypothetical protein
VARAHIRPIGMRHFIDAKIPDTVHIAADLDRKTMIGVYYGA